MKKISLLLAYRYLTYKSQDANIRTMLSICFLGIMIGTCALMLTFIITNGFEKTIHQKIQGINADITIEASGEKIDYQAIKTMLEKEYVNEIDSISGSSMQQAIIDKKGKQTVIALRGIDPEAEFQVTTLAKKMVLTTPQPQESGSLKHFENQLTKHGIIIGYKLAQEQNLKINDTIHLLIPEPVNKNKIFLNKKKCTVTGIYNIGLDEYDSNMACISLDLFNKFFSVKGVDAITIKARSAHSVTLTEIIKHFFQPELLRKNIVNKLKTRLPGMQVTTWDERYPALIASLKLEKYVMFLVIALITLVACMNMISLLFMFIQQKRRDIVILIAFGCSRRQITTIFLLIGLLITAFAASLGLGIAAAAGFILEHYKCIKLPDVYYVSHLPANLRGDLFIIVFFVTMLLSLLTILLPISRCKRINIAQVLKHEV